MINRDTKDSETRKRDRKNLSFECLSPVNKIEESAEKTIKMFEEIKEIDMKSTTKEDVVLKIIVDDFAGCRLILSRMLKKIEIKTLEALNGQDACKIVAKSLENNSKHRIKLILMDYDMPVMDGVQATRIIRNMENKLNKRDRIPIAAVTAFNGENVRQMCIETGMQHFLAKPVNMVTLKSLLQKYCLA